jgi:acetyl-CoA carboxylase biotin carboxyl carrier protein
MDLTPEDVAEILRAIDGAEVDELRLETSRFRLELRRTGAGWVQESEVLGEPDVIHLPDSATSARPGPSPAPEPVDGLHDVLAPLPGTFYRATEPGAPPLVEVGDEVDEDTVVGLLETMKLFNSVHAGVRGTVAEICVGNAETAEQGAVLVRVRPA